MIRFDSDCIKFGSWAPTYRWSPACPSTRRQSIPSRGGMAIHSLWHPRTYPSNCWTSQHIRTCDHKQCRPCPFKNEDWHQKRKPIVMLSLGTITHFSSAFINAVHSRVGGWTQQTCYRGWQASRWIHQVDLSACPWYSQRQEQPTRLDVQRWSSAFASSSRKSAQSSIGRRERLDSFRHQLATFHFFRRMSFSLIPSPSWHSLSKESSWAWKASQRRHPNGCGRFQQGTNRCSRSYCQGVEDYSLWPHWTRSWDWVERVCEEEWPSHPWRCGNERSRAHHFPGPTRRNYQACQDGLAWTQEAM